MPSAHPSHRQRRKTRTLTFLISATGLLAVIIMNVLALSNAQGAGTEGKPEPQTATKLNKSARQGKQDYQKWCADCHGKDGKGQGPWAEELKVKPSDLTRISARHDGDFPTRYVTNVIDGRVDSHAEFREIGPDAMPAWGKLFEDLAATLNEAEAADIRIAHLVQYIKSLQPESTTQ